MKKILLLLMITCTTICNGQWNIPVNGATVTSTGQNSFIGNTSGTIDLNFKTNNATRMTINRSSGSIGVNTTTPAQKLHLNGTMLIDGQGGSLSFGKETPAVGPTINWGEFNFEYWDGAGVPNNEKGLNLAKPFGSTLGNGSQSGLQNFIMFFNNDGNVGVGVPPASMDNAYKLNVCGAIKAKKVVVNSTWCDFVFAKDYKLKNLEEVEQFIKANNHLPEIPKAEVIELGGVDLGELVRLQMLKIEELTLYVIEQNKKSNLQKQEIDDLKKQLSLLTK